MWWILLGHCFTVNIEVVSHPEPGFNSITVSVGFVVYKIALGQVCLQVLWLPCQYHFTSVPYSYVHSLAALYQRCTSYGCQVTRVTNPVIQVVCRILRCFLDFCKVCTPLYCIVLATDSVIQ